MMNGEVTTSYNKSKLACLVLRNALKRYKKSPAELNASQLAEVEAQARTQYDIEDRVLASAEANEVVVAPNQVESALAEIQSRYVDEYAFQQDLANNGISADSFQAALYQKLKVDSVLDRVGEQALTQISEVDARIYYYMHLDKFYQPETRMVRHILITLNEDSPRNNRKVARKRLNYIALRLHRQPKRFPQQAKKYSECPTASEGGIIGWVPRGQLYPELDEVLFSMEEAQISGIVESPMGLHLLLCEEIHPEGIIPFEEAKPNILELLEKRYRRICQRNWLSKLKTVQPVSESMCSL